MGPTNKLVQDLIGSGNVTELLANFYRAEATYINTGHPDFLSGHKAMAIVNEKYQSSKSVQVDPKTGKPLPAALQKDTPTSQSLDNMPNEGGFFGSFFASKNKKKLAAMEPPPAVLKASGTLSERETIETEVISTTRRRYHWLITRIANFFIFQHCKENDD